jgi:hypothetical protein
MANTSERKDPPMARLPELDEKRLTAGQKEVYDRIKVLLKMNDLFTTSRSNSI